MTRVIYPGTFDPPTFGHLDIIEKAAHLFEHVYVAIGINSKKKPEFRLEQRVELLKKITVGISNVEIVTFDGLLVDYAHTLGVQAILRSIRNVTDFDEESLQAEMNRRMGKIETLYLIADEKYRFISSTLVREIASHAKRLHAFVPPDIEPIVFGHFNPLIEA